MTDELRQARHELRTPVNHILSYARLVAEEAADLALHDLVPMLEAIQAAGAEALSRIDAVLGQNSQPERLALHELARQIGEQAEQLGARAVAGGHGQLAEDARRISDAAGRLLALEDGGEAGRLGKSDEPSNAWKPAPTPDPVGAGFQQPLPDTDHPNLPDRRPPSPAARERGLGGEGLPATLLVVDDNEANRDVLSRSLSRLGYRVLRAEDGQVALDMLANDDVDLVLLDIMMPVLDGYAVLERRRADHRLLGIPFIVISATGDDASVIRCIEMGAEDYLPKPFDPVLLRARIGACLEKKRLHDQEQRHLATIEAQAAALAEWSQTLERRVAEQVTRLERLTGLTRFLPPQLAETIVDGGDESLLARHRRQRIRIAVDRLALDRRAVGCHLHLARLIGTLVGAVGRLIRFGERRPPPVTRRRGRILSQSRTRGDDSHQGDSGDQVRGFAIETGNHALGHPDRKVGVALTQDEGTFKTRIGRISSM